MGQHVETAVLLVPRLATSAVWDSGLWAWAALGTQNERLNRSDPSGGMWCCCRPVPKAAHFALFNLQVLRLLPHPKGRHANLFALLLGDRVRPVGCNPTRAIPHADRAPACNPIGHPTQLLLC